jgi:ATP-dependent protease ClpP protease subunit
MVAWRIVGELCTLDADFEYEAGRRKTMWAARHRWASPPPEIWTSLGDVDDAAAWRIAAVLDTAPDAPVCLNVDSLGGDPFAGFQIYEMLRWHAGPITAFAAHRCHSAAIIGFMGADTRLAGPDARFQVHGCARLPAERSCARVLRATAEELEAIDRRIVDVITCRAGRYGLFRLRADMEAETVLDANSALAVGILTKPVRS